MVRPRRTGLLPQEGTQLLVNMGFKHGDRGGMKGVKGGMGWEIGWDLIGWNLIDWNLKLAGI